MSKRQKKASLLIFYGGNGEEECEAKCEGECEYYIFRKHQQQGVGIS